MSLSPVREQRPLATAATAVRQGSVVNDPPVKLFGGSHAEA